MQSLDSTQPMSRLNVYVTLQEMAESGLHINRRRDHAQLWAGCSGERNAAAAMYDWLRACSAVNVT